MAEKCFLTLKLCFLELFYYLCSIKFFADMVTLDVIRRPVEEHIAGFEAFVERQFTAEGELLSEMLKYALSSRGKGIRPMLVMLSALLNSASIGAKVGQRSYVAAMLVEMSFTSRWRGWSVRG